LEQHVLLGACHEERRAEGEHEEACEIDVAPIHHVERARLGNNFIEDVHVMHFSVGNANECGDVAMQIEQRVHLDRAFGLAELGPRKQRQTEIDSRRIQRVESAIQFDTNRVFGVKRSGDADQILREVGEDAPVVRFVGIGQRGPRHLAAKAQMIQLALHRT